MMPLTLAGIGEENMILKVGGKLKNASGVCFCPLQRQNGPLCPLLFYGESALRFLMPYYQRAG